MENELNNLSLLFLNLNNIFQALFFIYIPTINAAIIQSMDQTCVEEELNMLLVTTGAIFQAFYKVMALTVTCTHASLPRSRIHNILFPDFIGSDFFGRNVFSDLERCEHLFWSLTGESIVSFRRIVEDVGPVMSVYTRQRQLRIRNSTFKLDACNRILMVFIWLRMYPEMAVLSALFMVSPTTIEEKFDFFYQCYGRIFVTWLDGLHLSNG